MMNNNFYPKAPAYYVDKDGVMYFEEDGMQFTVMPKPKEFYLQSASMEIMDFGTKEKIDREKDT